MGTPFTSRRCALDSRQSTITVTSSRASSKTCALFVSGPKIQASAFMILSGTFLQEGPLLGNILVNPFVYPSTLSDCWASCGYTGIVVCMQKTAGPFVCMQKQAGPLVCMKKTVGSLVCRKISWSTCLHLKDSWYTCLHEENSWSTCLLA